MSFQPSDTLRSRTFIGLILAQFLAAFNDQAIHASAMFYSMHQGTLTHEKAITLMPILFYAPWAIFCTLAGYLADRFSKRSSLVFWKYAEVGITLVAFLGFWLGTAHGLWWGPWMVMSTVFLMGLHSAFFVPAKYGVMPEILQPQLLSKGNGVLESSSFLAVILGTVTGGILSSPTYGFKGREYFIGLILMALALVGAACSLLIARMPAANPNRPFPTDPVKPLITNLHTLLRSRPLALAALGIAFFTFMVAFMRATVYEHGESQIPRWKEFETSLVVATVALGVGLGSPLAGTLSSGKVELGLVPLGAVGMIVSCLLAAVTILWLPGFATGTALPGLIASIILIGFFSGFYIVPLYTLLQHRAPKTSKGDLIATSNFLNVTGAIAASLLFFVLVFAAKMIGVAKPVPQQPVVVKGVLTGIEWRGGYPAYAEVQPEGGGRPWRIGQPNGQDTQQKRTRRGALRVDPDDLREGDEVAVSRYKLRGAYHYEIRPSDGKPPPDAYDREMVPGFLFIGASAMTLVILVLLCRLLPDFFVRALLWVRTHGRYRLKVIGLNNLPSDGPAILATNCDRFKTCMQVLAATDRYTRFILFESAADEEPRPLLRYLARRTGLVVLHSGNITPTQWDKALVSAARTIDSGSLLGLTIDSEESAAEAERFLNELREERTAAILPIYCEPIDTTTPLGIHRVRVVIGHPLPMDSSADELRDVIRGLGNWLEQTDRAGTAAATAKIPRAVVASPTTPAADPLSRP
jgi:MFS family permease